MTPLDPWIAGTIGAPADAPLAPGRLAAWQLARLNETLALAREQSPFYRQRLAAAPDGPDRLDSLDGLGVLPFTTAEDLRDHGLNMLCCSQGEIARVVSLDTSGTSGPAKRLFFTADDLERTVDFFHHGLTTFMEPGRRLFVCLPGTTPASVGDLLRQALPRLGGEAFVHGLVRDPGETLAALADSRAEALVGLPAQVLALARHPASRLGRGLESVLLCSDYVPRAVREAVAQAWGCRVLAHWGMTETGLGGGVECLARSGYHLRAADLFIEIVDPDTGRTLPAGASGEIVLTTLTRRGLPLIRYRTGDRGQLADGACACGSIVPRLARVSGRIAGEFPLPGGGRLALADLDELLFPLPWLLDFEAGVRRDGPGLILDLTLHATPDTIPGPARGEAAAALSALPPGASAGALRILPGARPTGAAKRGFTTTAREERP
jgi:phenylacetate-coenzyme A ligase PaaK-like adenylate-forming protein